MAIMIAAKAASSTEGANHDIMSVSDIVMRRDEKYMELLEQIEDYWTDRAEGYSQVNQEELAGDNRTNWRRELERHFRKTEQMRPIRFWISEPVPVFLLSCWHRKDIR